MKWISALVPAHVARGTIIAATTFTMLSACTVGPDFERPPLPISRHYDRKAEREFAARGAVTGSEHAELDSKPTGWWKLFGSAKLDRVMQQAIDGNLDLEAANATIAQANEAVAAAAGGLSPQLDIGAEGGRQRIAGQAGLSSANFYSVGPRVSFDFDFFGSTKRLVEEQSALADLQRHRFAAAYLTVTGDVASQALLFASARAQLNALQVLLTNDRKLLELVRSAHRYGSTTQIDIALATTQLAEDETLLPPLAQQRDTARHALSVLTGKGPADWVAPTFDFADFALPANGPISLPSELARRRPDILAAAARLHAASAAIGVATADLYPHLQLSAALNRVGPNPVGALWDIAAGLTAPVFHGGSLKANRRAAVDSYRAALADYRQTVIKSLGQVADLLQAINHDGEEYAAQNRALSAADISLRLNRKAYRAGEIGVLRVLNAERAYQRALIGQIRAQTARYLDTAQLAVALGGHCQEAFE